MDRYQQLIDENRLVSLAIPHGWLMLKNNLFNVDLDWLNNLQSIDADEHFMLMEFSFRHNVFNIFFDLTRSASCPHYESVNLYVSCYPVMENDKVIRFNYDVDLSLEGKRSRRNAVAGRWYGKHFDNLADVVKTLNQLMTIVSFQMDKMIEQSDFSIIESILDYHLPE